MSGDPNVDNKWTIYRSPKRGFWYVIKPNGMEWHRHPTWRQAWECLEAWLCRGESCR